jgi:acetolactate synthase-1/3 small subunit
MRSYGEIEVTRSGAIAVSLEAKKLRLAPPIPRNAVVDETDEKLETRL